jgi:type IV pilus assembly protein PilY1
MKSKVSVSAFAAGLIGLTPLAAWAQTSTSLVIQDDFTEASATNSWIPYNGACLTAGNGSGSIPACYGLPYYKGQTLVGGYTGTIPSSGDPVGNGALRFTNGYTTGAPGGNFAYGFNQAGGIISNFTFPSNQGLQITFTTVTYRGDSGGAGGDGADGISFFLTDGSASPYDTGAFGGSLGYTCSNVNNDPNLHPDGTPRQYDGIDHGYLGLGIDEYGNFLNQSDNTASGWGYQPGRIGLRGAGSIRWGWLNFNYPTQYPSSLTLAQQASAVQKTCSTGFVWDFSKNPNSPVQTTTAVADYTAIPNAYNILPSTVQIANESAIKRSDGTPISYQLTITPTGLLSLGYSLNGGAAYQPVITGQSITASNGTLPANFRFGFNGSTGGSTNIHEIMCFRVAPAPQSASSAGLNQLQTAKVQTGSQVYFAFYNPSTWAGSLSAYNLVTDSNNNLSISSVANWDGSCVLTGVASGQVCAATGATSGTAEAPAARNILSWNGTQGVPFEWTSLSGGEDTALGVTSRLSYLRGDRTNELNALGVGLYRARASVLGDIIDSSPTWVGPPSAPYPATWQDSLIVAGANLPENAGQSYPNFMTSSAQTRLNVVYTGANDGLLHGFESGSYSSSNTYVNNSTTPNDGKEVLAYMPGLVVNDIHNTTTAALDFSNPKYGHNYYVDAPPGTGDLFYNGSWHTWLVGGLGPGGAAIYALDITDPTQFSPETTAAKLVIGEWTSATITCVNVANCGNNLGNTYGVPQIRRFHNGDWGAVFGNGLGSASGDAGIFVMDVNSSTGVPTFYYFSTGVAGNNGITYTTPADLDGDHITDYVYAGDVLGNVWRFDLTNGMASNWTAANKPLPLTPLFTTPAGQPITSKLIVALTPSSQGVSRVLVEFGTGQQIPFTNTAATSYAKGTQSLYGVWDWNLSAWNAMSPTQYWALTPAQYAAILPKLPNPIAKLPYLTQQTITSTVAATTTDPAYRTVSSNVICWQNATDCTSGNTQFGWYLDLPGSSEQVIYAPTLSLGVFVVNTTIPATNSPTTCTTTVATGWTMGISPATGGALANSVFSDSTGNFNTVNRSGLQLDGTGSISIVTTATTSTAKGATWFVTQTSSLDSSNNNNQQQAPGYAGQFHGTSGITSKRLTWIERR